MDRSQVSASLFCGLLAIPAGISVAAAAAQPVPVTPGFNAGEFMLTPDGSRVVFGKWDVSPGMLYSARIDGVGTPVPLSPLTGGDAALFNSRISPDSAWIVYHRIEHPDDRLHVATYASRIDGTLPPVLLNLSRVYDDDSSGYNVAISPDSRYAVVRADRGDNSFDLISRRIDGSSPPVLLNGEPHSENDGHGVGYDWTGAGEGVVFHSRGGASGPGFFTRAFDGSGELVPLSPAEMPGISAVSGDGSTILLVTAPTGESLTFYSNSTAGGALTPLPVDTSPPFGLRGLSISPDGDHGLIVDSEFRILTLPTDGSAAPVALGPFANGVNAGPAVISPDSSRVVYAMRDDHHGANGLYVSAIDGSGTATRLSLPPPQPEDRVVNYGGGVVFSNDGRHVLYAADELAKNVYGLFSVPLDGSRPAVHLTESTNFALTPDGQWVVAARLTNGDSYFDEFVAIPIGGGEPALLAENPFLTGGIPAWGSHWHLSEDGRTLVFLADDNAGVREIFAVSIPEPDGVCSLVAMVSALLSRRRR